MRDAPDNKVKMAAYASNSLSWERVFRVLLGYSVQTLEQFFSKILFKKEYLVGEVITIWFKELKILRHITKH